jgi:hypothetical protein
MIDLPPILGLAETIRLSGAVDSIALIIRWGRTERQFVQFALDALRSAGVVASTAILNDIDLRAQQRRGYRDRSLIYADKRLYRTAAGDREPDARAALQAAAGSANRQADRPEVRPRDTYRYRSDGPRLRQAWSVGTGGQSSQHHDRSDRLASLCRQLVPDLPRRRGRNPRGASDPIPFLSLVRVPTLDRDQEPIAAPRNQWIQAGSLPAGGEVSWSRS